MLQNIETMTRRPHPSGSQELADVRTYLLSQLDGRGVSYQVLETLVSLDEIKTEQDERIKSKPESKRIRTKTIYTAAVRTPFFDRYDKI